MTTPPTPPATSAEGILAEYNSLRHEIVQTTQMNIQGYAITLPVVTTIIAYGFQVKSPIAFSAAIVILLSTMWYSVILIRAIMSTGAYIHAILEPKVAGLQWESMLKQNRKQRGISYANTSVIIVILYATLVAGCIISFWI